MARLGLLASVIAAGLGLTSPALSQTTVYIPAILELSGAGAVSGTNFRDGMLLAVEEINAKGGILGRKINNQLLDTQSDASISRAQVQKVLDNDPHVILGPVFSGSVLVSMLLTQQANIPQIVGGEAAAITQKAHPSIFRTSFGQQFSMPKIANYIRDGIKAKTVAILWVNNDFGKGGRDNFNKEMAARNIKVVADVSTESGQADFSADVVKIKAANADAIFVYTNEEESARFLREARKQGIKAPGMDDMPDMSTQGWVGTNGSYGYGCACMTVRTDRRTMRVTRLYSATPVPLRQCRADPRLRRPS